jgi:uncharacterized protein (TIGR00251 family)
MRGVRGPMVQDKPDGVHLSVHVKPRASKSRVVGVRAGVLDVAVAAPPVDGAANEELVRTLASHFGLPARQVTVVSGATGKSKRVRLSGIAAEEVHARLADAAD